MRTETRRSSGRSSASVKALHQDALRQAAPATKARRHTLVQNLEHAARGTFQRSLFVRRRDRHSYKCRRVLEGERDVPTSDEERSKSPSLLSAPGFLKSLRTLSLAPSAPRRGRAARLGQGERSGLPGLKNQCHGPTRKKRTFALTCDVPALVRQRYELSQAPRGRNIFAAGTPPALS